MSPEVENWNHFLYLVNQCEYEVNYLCYSSSHWTSAFNKSSSSIMTMMEEDDSMYDTHVISEIHSELRLRCFLSSYAVIRRVVSLRTTYVFRRQMKDGRHLIVSHALLWRVRRWYIVYEGFMSSNTSYWCVGQEYVTERERVMIKVRGNAFQ